MISEKIKELKKTQFYRSNRRAILKTRIYQALNFAGFYILTTLKNSKDKELFKDVKSLCLFIGHGRSGHSIVGALLDAHPNVILSDETDFLKYFTAGFNKERIYQILLIRSQKEARRQREKMGRNEKKYSYWVPGQWQGRHRKIQVVGDSKASVTARKLVENPVLLKQVCKKIDDHLKLIHVVRNPYDNISTISIHGESLEDAIYNYFANCDAVVEIRKGIDANDLIVIRHEDLIDQPKNTLKHLVQFIGVEPFEDYLDASAGIIFKSPSNTRHLIEWDANSIGIVKQSMTKYDFLTGYSYTDDC